MITRMFATAIVLLATAILISAQAPAGQTGSPASQASGPAVYQPKFAGDPAHSDAEAAALGYMRTVVNAQKNFYKRHHSYATSLRELVGQGSFTRRMENPNRGDYTVHFRSTSKEYSVSLVPKQYDSAHRAFYVDETGEFRAEENELATRKSPALK